MTNKVRKAFRTTKIKIDKASLPDQKSRDTLEELFLTMDAAKTDAVAAERRAAVAVAKARANQSGAQIAEMEFLQKAADHFNAVAGERMWIVYRDPEGVITLEGFTERLIRNNMRAQQAMLGSQVANSDSDEDVDRSGLYEVEGEEEETDPNSLN